jgi:uncharacterized damage-inducible protein DinB
MIPYGAAELAASFRTVRDNTIRAAEDLPEGQYDFRAVPDWWSVRELVAHIAVAPRLWRDMHGTQRLTTLVGYDFFGMRDRIEAAQQEPRTKAELVALLREEGERTAEWLASYDDAGLADPVTQPDGRTTKSRFEMLLGVKEHEMHHRAQLMLIQRLLGIVPHGTRVMQERAAAMRRRADEPTNGEVRAES